MPKVLIIEDDADIRGNIADILMLEGFDTIEAADGVDGLLAVNQHHPDCIVCDIMMPRMDGFAVLERLQEQITTAGIPTVLITAVASPENCNRGTRLGAKKVIAKPFNHFDLLQVVKDQVPA